MGYSFMENTQSGQIPEGRAHSYLNRALTLEIVPLGTAEQGSSPLFSERKKKIKKTMSLKG